VRYDDSTKTVIRSLTKTKSRQLRPSALSLWWTCSKLPNSSSFSQLVCSVSYSLDADWCWPTITGVLLQHTSCSCLHPSGCEQVIFNMIPVKNARIFASPFNIVNTYRRKLLPHDTVANNFSWKRAFLELG
jgi:hypothetical protein